MRVESRLAQTGRTFHMPLISLDMPANELAALAQLAQRIGLEDIKRFAGSSMTYGARSEGDTMWSAVCLLQRQLADAGYAPR
jgi:hypothetical protein